MPNLTGNTTTIDKIAETKDPIETGVVLYGSSTGTETTKMKLYNIFEKTAFMKLKTAAKNIIDAINELKNRTDKLNTDIRQMDCGIVSCNGINANEYKDIDVTFNKSFMSAPIVVSSLTGASEAASAYAKINSAPINETKDGFTLRIYAADIGTGKRTPAYGWIAVERK